MHAIAQRITLLSDFHRNPFTEPMLEPSSAGEMAVIFQEEAAPVFAVFEGRGFRLPMTWAFYRRMLQSQSLAAFSPGSYFYTRSM
jgi:hypothetical protein